MLRALLVLLLLPALLCAAVPRTLINGSLNLPSGTNPSVTIKLTPSEPFIVSDAGGSVYQILAPVTYNVSNSGALFMYVVPNTGSSNVPDYTTYTVEVSSGTRPLQTLTWRVPTSSLALQAGNMIATPSETVTPTSALPLAGGTMTGKITLSSTSALAGLRWPLSTAPTPSPEEGDTYISSVDGKMYIRYLGAWTTASGAIPSPAQQTEGTRKVTTTAAKNIAGTASAGTGVQAAADDHVHTIGTGVVTNAMLAGSITGNKISTVPNLLTNVTGDLIIDSAGTAVWFAETINVSSTVFTDMAANAATSGKLQRNGGNLSFYDATRATRIPRVIFANTADIGTVANQTSLTSFGTITTLVANDLAAGNVIHIDAWGFETVATNAAQTHSFDIRIGGTSIGSLSGYNFASTTLQTKAGFHLSTDIFVRSAGLSGSVFPYTAMTAGYAGTNQDSWSAGLVGSVFATPAAVTLPGSGALTILYKIGVSNASNTATLNNVIVTVY